VSKRPENPVEVALDTLEAMWRLAEDLQTEIILLMAEARHRDITWEAIADRLGGSRQKFHQRYHRHVYAQRTHDILRADLTDACANYLKGQNGNRSNEPKQSTVLVGQHVYGNQRL
jgi:hypothetical protein